MPRISGDFGARGGGGEAALGRAHSIERSGIKRSIGQILYLCEFAYVSDAPHYTCLRQSGH